MKRLVAVLAVCAGVPIFSGCFEPTGFSNGPNQADPDLGYVDGLGLDSKFLPAPRGGLCSNGPCYPTQQGFAGGQPIYFYNLGTVSTGASALVDSSGNFAVPTSLVTINVSDFSGSSCAPPTTPYTFNPMTENFPSDTQFPVFSGQPLTSYVFGSVVVPIVARYAATEPSSTVCQAFKQTSSVGSKFGSSAGSLADYQMWPVISVVQALQTSASSGIVSTTEVDGATCAITANNPQTTIGCPVSELPAVANSQTLQTQCAATYSSCTGACQSGDNVCVTVCQSNYIACATLERQAWTAGLQLTFLNGGPVPLNSTDPGTFLVMDGVIVHPSGLNNLSLTNAPNVVILPALPGQPGYSPIVRLHDFHVPPGTDLDSSGDFYNTTYTSICPTPGGPCQPNEVDISQTASALNLIFVVTSAP